MEKQNEMVRAPDIASATANKQSRKCWFECFLEEEADGKKKLSAKKVDKAEYILEKITGTPNKVLAGAIVEAGTDALPYGMDLAKKHNLIVQALSDATPRDAHEARLVTQATVLYTQGMDFMERARGVLSDRDSTFAKDHWHTILMKSATKLLDLHIKTIDALTRYRHQGEQKITVQHVNIESGGKAIVGGTIVSGGGSSNELSK